MFFFSSFLWLGKFEWNRNILMVDLGKDLKLIKLSVENRGKHFLKNLIFQIFSKMQDFNFLRDVILNLKNYFLLIFVKKFNLKYFIWKIRINGKKIHRKKFFIKKKISLNKKITLKHFSYKTYRKKFKKKSHQKTP